MQQCGRARRGQRGATLIVVALTLPVMLGFLALAVDLGYAYAQRRLTQSAADAAAIAGALMLGRTVGDQGGDHYVWTTIMQTEQALLSNPAERPRWFTKAFYADATGTPQEIVGNPCGPTPDYAARQGGGVTVQAQQSVPTLFGRFLGAASDHSYASNAVQVLTFTGNPTSGTYYLTLFGGDYVSAQLDYTMTADQIAGIVNNLAYTVFGDTIPPNSIQVTQTGTNPKQFTISFVGGMGNLNVIALSPQWVNLDQGGISITTQQQGSGEAREVTVRSATTAYLKPITGIHASAADVAPYVIWRGSVSGKADLGQTVTLFDKTSYLASWVNNPTPDPAWQGGFGSFTGALTTLPSAINVGDTITSGQQSSPSAIDQLQAAWDNQSPLVLPVVTAKAGASNAQLTVSGFAFVQLRYGSNPRPSSAASTITGKVVYWADQGHETTTGTGSPAGTNALAMTVLLGPTTGPLSY